MAVVGCLCGCEAGSGSCDRSKRLKAGDVGVGVGLELWGR